MCEHAIFFFLFIFESLSGNFESDIKTARFGQVFGDFEFGI